MNYAPTTMVSNQSAIKITDKNYDFAFIGDSFTEGTPIEYEDSFVGIFDEKNTI